MSFWDVIKHDFAEISEALHRDKLAERTWECDPLLVIDEFGAIAYSGHTFVDVTPHADGSADVVARADVEGWHPSLENAIVRCYTPSVTTMTRGTRYIHGRDGICCRGRDKEGFNFEWYINGAAENHFSGGRLSGF